MPGKTFFVDPSAPDEPTAFFKKVKKKKEVYARSQQQHVANPYCRAQGNL